MSRPPEPMPRAQAASLLGGAPDASGADGQRAFRRAARRVHPDVLGEADEAARRSAAEAFDQLSRARAAMLERPLPVSVAAYAEARGVPDGPQFRRVPGRGLGGSLVVLALLAFLLVGLVSLQQAVQGAAFDPPAASTPP